MIKLEEKDKEGNTVREEYYTALTKLVKAENKKGTTFLSYQYLKEMKFPITYKEFVLTKIKKSN